MSLARSLLDGIDARWRPYRLWSRRNEPGPAELAAMRGDSRSWSHRPKISLVTPVHDPSKYALTCCIESVVGQSYDNWELCLVDGGSTRPHVAEVIAKLAAQDSRIKTASMPENRGIAGNSNAALRLASGEYVGFLDHDDVLAPFALHEVVSALNRDPSIDFLYSDEDKIPAAGTRRYDPAFKSDWAPDTLLSYNYPCHFAVVRRSLLEEIGGVREGFDGAQDYDLILRVGQRTTRIEHIHKVLYHWRAAEASTAASAANKPHAETAARKAIADHLRVRGIAAADVVGGQLPTTYRVRYPIRGTPAISIIIPTRDRVDLLRRCVESVLAKTSYDRYEIVIVDNQSEEAATGAYYEELRSNARIRILRYDSPFNFSAINNFAVGATDAAHVLFLNNDTEVIAPDWLTAMLEYSQRDDVGAVGARLYYPDGTIQHAGLILGIGGVAGHAHLASPPTSAGYMGRIKIVQNLSAVTAACLMMRHEVFDAVGGFDEGLSHAFNDVDLCLKIRRKGYLIVYTPYAELHHHESATRGYETTPEKKVRFAREGDLVKARWKDVLEAGDPYYNPNLTLTRLDFSLRL